MADASTHLDLRRTIIIAGTLTLLGLTANALPLPVTYSVSFIFGSVFSTIAVGLLGPWWGAGVALVATGSTYQLWGHPYAIVIVTAEALWLGMALKRGRHNILLINALYWLCLGTPLVLLSYAGIMGMGGQSTAIIALKHAMNGLFNVQIAGIVLFFTPAGVWLGIQPRRPRSTYADLLFLLVAIFVMTSTLGLLLLENRRHIAMAQQQVVATVHAEVRETEGVVARWVNRLVNAARVISSRKQMEEQIKSSLQEQEVMLKEIHHRVKNNMLVIYSLLNLQAKGIADRATRAMFEESRNRVSSMAMIHERLYQSTDLASINFKEYLQCLLADIADTYRRPDVSWMVEMEPLDLDINMGIPCGLIVNELVSNSFKYAFPDGRAGGITLGIRKGRAGENLLTVADNGIGFPPGVDFKNTTSLGLQIVTVLTNQIHGTIELASGEGTKFCITFPGHANNKGSDHG